MLASPLNRPWSTRGLWGGKSFTGTVFTGARGAGRGIRTTLGHFCQPLSLSKEPRGNFRKTRNPSWASHLVWNYGRSIVDICLPQQLIILAGEKPFRLRPHFTEGAICDSKRQQGVSDCGSAGKFFPCRDNGSTRWPIAKLLVGTSVKIHHPFD